MVRLQTEISRFLSSSAASDSVASKPTASVMPQVQPCHDTMTMAELVQEIPAVTCDDITAEPPSEIPVGVMEMDADEADTTVSVDTSDADISLESTSREISQHVERTSHDCVALNGRLNGCGTQSPSAECHKSNCCDSVKDGTDSNLLGNHCHGGGCHGNSDATAANCSEYEAASVLSELDQLAAVAMMNPSVVTANAHSVSRTTHSGVSATHHALNGSMSNSCGTTLHNSVDHNAAVSVSLLSSRVEDNVSHSLRGQHLLFAYVLVNSGWIDVPVRLVSVCVVTGQT